MRSNLHPVGIANQKNRIKNFPDYLLLTSHFFSHCHPRESGDPGYK